MGRDQYADSLISKFVLFSLNWESNQALLKLTVHIWTTQASQAYFKQTSIRAACGEVLSHFADKKTEAQNGWVISIQSRRATWGGLLLPQAGSQGPSVEPSRGKLGIPQAPDGMLLECLLRDKSSHQVIHSCMMT